MEEILVVTKFQVLDLDIWESEEGLTNGLERVLTATNTLFPDSIFIFQVYLYVSRFYLIRLS